MGVGEQDSRELSLQTSAIGPHGDQRGGSGQDEQTASPVHGHSTGELADGIDRAGEWLD